MDGEEEEEEEEEEEMMLMRKMRRGRATLRSTLPGGLCASLHNHAE